MITIRVRAAAMLALSVLSVGRVHAEEERVFTESMRLLSLEALSRKSRPHSHTGTASAASSRRSRPHSHTGTASAASVPQTAGDAKRYLVIDLSSGASSPSYPVSYAASLADPIPDEFRTKGLVLRRVPAGLFCMGSPAGEVGRWDGHENQHSVRLTQDFYIGVFEVTQRQWQLVLGTRPSHCKEGAWEKRPVEGVSYADVRGPSNGSVHPSSFLSRLRIRTGLSFDLPTEAQWEYACRAGTTTALNNGTDLTSAEEDGNLAGLGRYRHNGGSAYSSDPTMGGSAVVGSYRPNAWGLYDMHGNVWEWCLDWWTRDFTSAAVTDPGDPRSGSSTMRSAADRVIRGGGWIRPAKWSRSASRRFMIPDTRWSDVLGFRVVLSAGQHAAERTSEQLLSLFWPLDLAAAVRLDQATFEEDVQCIPLEAARKRVSTDPDDPHAYVQLVGAIQNENIAEDCRPHNRKIADLYESEEERAALSGEQYVAWAAALSRLGDFDGSVEILERGLDAAASVHDRLVVARHLGPTYILEASRAMLPPWFGEMISDSGVGELARTAESSPDFVYGKNYTHEFSPEQMTALCGRFLDDPTDHRHGLSLEQKATVRSHIEKARELMLMAVQEPEAGSIDFFHVAWFSSVSPPLLAAIDNRENGADPMAMFTSPYLARAFDMGRGNARVEAARSLTNIAILLAHAKAMMAKSTKASVEDNRRATECIERERRKLEDLARSPSAPALVHDALAFVYFLAQESSRRIQRECTVALSKNPSMRNAFALRLLHLAQAGRWGEAIQCTEERLVRDHLAASYRIAACCYAFNGQLDKAEKRAFEGMVFGKPCEDHAVEQVLLRLIMSTVALKRGDSSKGVDAMMKLYKGGERHLVLLYNLAVGLYQQGKYRDSYSLLTQLEREDSAQVYSDQMMREARKLKALLIHSFRR